MNTSESKKSGMVTLVGRSNVGKSTLLNALVGFKMAPVSARAQTTRWALKGILNEERGQAVFVDTPGLFLEQSSRLTSLINKQVTSNIDGVDVILYVVDPNREIGVEEKRLLSMVRNMPHKILVINKIDTNKPKYLYNYEHLGEEEFDAVVKISAKTGAHLKSLKTELFNLLPEGDNVYSDEEQFANQQSFKTWIAEMIREKLFNHLDKEVPYSTHVVVDNVDKRDNGMLMINATIYTDSDRYRPMIIGKNGHMLKSVGTEARKELEVLLQKKVFLKLRVETDAHWVEHVQ